MNISFFQFLTVCEFFFGENLTVSEIFSFSTFNFYEFYLCSSHFTISAYLNSSVFLPPLFFVLRSILSRSNYHLFSEVDTTTAACWRLLLLRFFPHALCNSKLAYIEINSRTYAIKLLLALWHLNFSRNRVCSRLIKEWSFLMLYTLQLSMPRYWNNLYFS